jgi:hypothetical protein
MKYLLTAVIFGSLCFSCLTYTMELEQEPVSVAKPARRVISPEEIIKLFIDRAADSNVDLIKGLSEENPTIITKEVLQKALNNAQHAGNHPVAEFLRTKLYGAPITSGASAGPKKKKKPKSV